MAFSKKYSLDECQFIKDGIHENVRADGRTRKCYREIGIKSDIIHHLYSSAKITIGKTKVIASTTLRVGEPLAHKPDQGVISIDVKSINKQKIIWDRFGTYEKISNVLQLIYTSPNCLDLKTLSLIKCQKCWHINVDILVIDDNGNVSDASGLAVRTVLLLLKIPKVNITEVDGFEEIEIDEDPLQACGLSIISLPFLLTVNIIGKNYIYDALPIEEQCADLLISFGVCAETNRIFSIHFDEFGTITIDKLVDISKSVKKIVIRMNSAYTNAMDSETATLPKIQWI
ncbi:hypothetical protein HZS_7459 [Henneguya salminicola]|nr:hypothetical protein HZS_7459 [Henneguya salminicola]